MVQLAPCSWWFYFVFAIMVVQLPWAHTTWVEWDTQSIQD